MCPPHAETGGHWDVHPLPRKEQIKMITEQEIAVFFQLGLHLDLGNTNKLFCGSYVRLQ